MTGEGITPAMESALLAAPVVRAAVAAGRADRSLLAPYETAFRAHFGQAFGFLDFLAAVLRNRELARPWLQALRRGCELANADAGFAATAGSYFGGLDVRPGGIMSMVWSRILGDLMLSAPRTLFGLAAGSHKRATTLVDLAAWQLAWWRSMSRDPIWHLRWMLDVQRKAMRESTRMTGGSDPRRAGVAEIPTL
jgi:hypothetical protein